jgi:hypothetical protein
VPFDIISDLHLTLEKLRSFPLLIVAGTQYMSRDNVETIRQYVEQGGSLIFTHHSAFGDATGRLLDSPLLGLIKPLGASDHLVDFVKPAFPTGDTRFKVREFEHFALPPGGEVLATYTPPCIDVTDTEWVAHQPMPGIDTDQPAVVLGRSGRGKFIYIGCRLFKEYLRHDHPALRHMIRHCIDKLMTQQVHVKAPRVVEAVFARKGDTFKVFLINGITSKPCAQPSWSDEGLAFHANIDEIIPIHGIEIELRGFDVRAASNLAGVSLPVSGECVHVPQIGLYDVITIKATRRT